jgi:hypothetical protein
MEHDRQVNKGWVDNSEDELASSAAVAIVVVIGSWGCM